MTTGEEHLEKPATDDGGLGELRRRYDELQLRVTRFSAVEHELILARQRLDRQVTIYRRIQQFNAAALQAGDEAEFATLTAEAMADIFEVEIGIYVADSALTSPDAWGVQGISPDTARALVRHLATNKPPPAATLAWPVPDDVLGRFLDGPPLKQAMVIGGQRTDGSNAPLMIAANTCDGARFYEAIRPEDLDACAVLAEQVAAHVMSRRDKEAIRASLREKEALLKEVHHRVKNNLQVVTSLLRLEARRTNSPHCCAIVTSLQGRVRAMALLHETLYRGDSFAAVDLRSYLMKIANESLRLAASCSGSVRLQFTLAPASVDIGQATACGLIVNELVANSLKHAFGGGERDGEIRVILAQEAEEGALSLEVSDNGAGLPTNFAERAEHSLGLQLVKDLAHQLGGGLTIGPAPAARFVVKFSIKPIRAMAL